MNIPCTTHVGDQDQVEVRVAIDCESYSSFLHTGHSVITKTHIKLAEATKIEPIEV